MRCPDLFPEFQGEVVAQMCCPNFKVVLPKVLPKLLPERCCPNRKRVFRLLRTTVCHRITRTSSTLFAALARTIWATLFSPKWQACCCARTFFCFAGADKCSVYSKIVWVLGLVPSSAISLPALSDLIRMLDFRDMRICMFCSLFWRQL